MGSLEKIVKKLMNKKPIKISLVVLPLVFSLALSTEGYKDFNYKLNTTVVSTKVKNMIKKNKEEINICHYNIKSEKFYKKVAKDKFVEDVDQRLNEILKAPEKNKVEITLEKIIYNYDFFIERASKKYGIEKEIIVALIAKESSGRLGVVSERGAAGIMQLKEKTAKDVGLKINDYIDERFSPKSIEGGVKYLALLKKFYKKYASNHMLSLIAYNYGLGSVNKVLSEMNYCFEPQKEWDKLKKLLPKESREFVLDVFALKKLAAKIYRKSQENFEKLDFYIIKTDKWKNKSYINYISKKYNVDFNKIAYFNKHIKDLNKIPPQTEIFIPLKKKMSEKELASK